MAYLCTKDHCTPPGEHLNREGTYGPRGTKLDAMGILDHPKKERWKTYDDDDNLCHEGWYVHEDKEDGEFEPLDCLSGPDVGATYMKYLDEKTGKWEVL